MATDGQHPPPPPPAPPLEPFELRVVCNAPESKGLLVPKGASVWPHRLLHVGSMTSHVKVGVNTYGDTIAPQYNVVSYTWGYYVDRTSTEPALEINGIDWPIPPVQKSHFTPSTFEQTIHCVARGVKHHCSWIWLDVACIPQEHEYECDQSKRLREQEIGNQVEIFQRAKEAFVWLSSLTKKELLGSEPSLVSVLDLVMHANTAVRGFPNAEVATEFLDTWDEYSMSYTAWMYKILKHPWFYSLWCLQEMVLRKDACILFDDGMLFLGARAITGWPEFRSQSPWNLTELKNDVSTLRSFLIRPQMRQLEKALGFSEKDSLDPITLEPVHKDKVTVARNRLKELLSLQEERGLDALDITMPHTVYSLAQYRRVSKRQDRIHGIVQTYGISCTLFPQGQTEEDQLHALEDEFGAKLVHKAPLLSQLFVHSCPDRPPRRTWLITQMCKVDDLIWSIFTSKYVIEHLFTEFDVTGVVNLRLKFIGRAWLLEEFVDATLSASGDPEKQKQLFCATEAATPDRYRGLILDHHISKALLGHVCDYFGSLAEMIHAVTALNTHYRPSAPTNLSQGSCALKVALMGSGAINGTIPVLNYVGLVLAPKFTSHPSDMHDWERIGLMRWSQIYSQENKGKLHYSLSSSHAFQCMIV